MAVDIVGRKTNGARKTEFMFRATEVNYLCIRLHTIESSKCASGNLDSTLPTIGIAKLNSRLKGLLTCVSMQR